MKKQPLTLALAMIVKGSPDEAKVLDRCLGNLEDYVDGIFITGTYRKDVSETDPVERVARKHHAVFSTFQWQHDFSAARNFNFAQVPKEFSYILWTDADDMWRGVDKLKSIMRKAGPAVDGFAFWYLYDWDEFKRPVVVHKKTMIVKNDGSTKWTGAIHEDLEPLRQVEIRLIDGIDRLHLTDKVRVAESAKRNVEIAERQTELLSEEPRTYWNLANAQMQVGDYDRAVRNFGRFLDLTHSEDEKYLAYCRLAEVERVQGHYERAAQLWQTAIGLIVEHPDAYLQLAYMYFLMGDFDRAEKYCLDGMVRRPRIHKMIVFNPRDYDFNPMMLLAQIYRAKGRPDLMLPLLKGCSKIYPDDKHLKQLVKDGDKEKRDLARALTKVQELQKIRGSKKLKAALDALPLEIRSHPAVVMLRNKNFSRTESSGRDVAIYCGNTTQQWNPETFKKEGIGGSEEAVIHLAREWAELGWNVTVYNNCGHKEIVADDVIYRPFWEFNYRDKYDIVIFWRQPRGLDAPVNAPKVFVDLHDVTKPGEFTPERLKRVTKVMVKSKFHRALLPNVPDDKISVVPNGFVAPTYDASKRDPRLIINTSSPDRSMDVMPEIFSLIKSGAPNARMIWAYGWDNFKRAHANDPKKLEWMSQMQKEIDAAGIETAGRLTQAQVSELYSRASIFLYPTEFAEIDCISVKKAQAAGNIAVTTDFAALKESNKLGVKIHSPKTVESWDRPYQFHFGVEGDSLKLKFATEVVKQLRSGTRPSQEDALRFAQKNTWHEVALQWDKLFRA